MSTEIEMIQDYLNAIGDVIKTLQKENNITQTNLVDICHKKGFDISQATISQAINGKGDIRLYTLIAISTAFDMEIDDFFLKVKEVMGASDIKNIQAVKLAQQISSTNTITNPCDSAFSGYLGNFFIYFYRTTGMTKELVRGELVFCPSPSKKKCLAKLILKFKPDEFSQKKDEKEAEKTYEGEMFISQKMRVAYCYLYSEKAGEVCMLIFKHWYILQSSLKCTMALAITTSSGANRLPTVHRMCLSRKKIYPDKMEYVKGQLLLNDANIILTGEQIGELLSDKNIPDSFKELLKKNAAKNHCAYIQETTLYDTDLSESEQIKWISYVRAHSCAPKYNKVSRRTEEALYSLLETD